MERKITGFHLDAEQDWVAELDCYHNQHVRHNPPFINRPWVSTEAGRNEKIGATLYCKRCDQLEFPEELKPYKRTPEFTELTVPKGLLKDHSTKTGTWGLINVIEGSLHYTVNYPETKTMELTKGQQGVVVPCMLHSVKPNGRVVFYVEFYLKE